jgi:energy-coupling factor transporter ATP-binding protein EcfA2
MRLGEILVAQGLVSAVDVNAALRRQLSDGGRLGENLVAIGALTGEQLSSVIHSIPAIPASLGETGVAPRLLIDLMLKVMHLEPVETAAELGDRLKLPGRLAQQMLSEASQQKFVQSLGTGPGNNPFAIRYTLSDAGRAAAREALSQCLYVGPAPVPLAAYQEQIERQRIANEMLDAGSLRGGLDGLVVSDYYLRKLLPAINAGRSMLLFGPSGNGKTTLATRIAGVFRDVVYIPYAVEIGGQIMKVFDPALHKPSMSPEEAAALSNKGLQSDPFDARWVGCKRPIVVAGGELTLDMLDLQYNREAKFYSAPLQVKALNGIFLIDDFGRQRFHPNDLLNRWIVPMESQVDYFSLASGSNFSLPFDQLLVFSTNLPPSDLMDPAFLRRIPYKIKVFSPALSEYRQLFDSAARTHGLMLSDEVFDFVVHKLTRVDRVGLAYHQPKFICEQVTEFCRSFNLAPRLTAELAAEALANLYFDRDDATTDDDAIFHPPTYTANTVSAAA